MKACTVRLGPLETALVIMGGNWDAEGAGELVATLCPWCVDTAAVPNGEGWSVEVWGASDAPNVPLYVQGYTPQPSGVASGEASQPTPASDASAYPRGIDNR